MMMYFLCKFFAAKLKYIFEISKIRRLIKTMAGMHVCTTFFTTLVDLVQHLPSDLSPFAEFLVAQPSHYFDDLRRKKKLVIKRGQTSWDISTFRQQMVEVVFATPSPPEIQ